MTVILAWLLADFISGILHWSQDHYLNDDCKYKFLKRVSRDNTLHHKHPAYLTHLTPWQNINTTVPLVLPIMFVLFLFGAPDIILLTLFFSIFANIVHRWAHLPINKVPFLIRQIQRTGLFISSEHHSKHHYNKYGLIKKENSTIRFCPMTNWLNPILDYFNFWSLMQNLLKMLGIKNV